MRDYVIINGVNSLTIDGLAISKLPPITKPLIRSQREEIDGRDGDIITELGYSAYDKQLEIGLFGSFDIDSIIKYFTGEGTIVFSNEADKYYNFKIINQIDYEKLLKFKTATITLHCQPFKYPVEETPIEGVATTVTGSGSNITLNNTVVAPMTIALKGNTSQNTTTPNPYYPQQVHTVSGDNTIKVNGRNFFEPFANGSITSQQEATTSIATIKQTYNYTRVLTFNNGEITGYPKVGNGSFYIFNLTHKNLKPNTTYTISLDYDFTNLTGKTGNLIIYGYILIAPSGQTSTSGKVVKTFTTNANGEFVFNSAFLNIAMVCCNENTFMKLSNIMLVEGQYTSTTMPDYEAYTGNSYNIDLSSKNLAYTGWVSDFITRVNDSSKAVLYMLDNRVCVKWWSTTGYGDYDNKYIFKTNWKENTQYTFSFDLYTTSTNDFGNLCIAYTDGTITEINGIYNQWTHKIQTSTSGKTIKYLRANWRSGESYIDINTFMVNEGTTALPYTEYFTPIELCKIGDYQDRIYKDSGKWYLEKQIGKVVLDGSENSWVKYSALDTTNNNCYYIPLDTLYVDSTGATKVCLSNYFTGVSFNDKGTDTANMWGSNFAKQLYLKIKNTITTIGELQTWLSTHNTIVYYILATPTTTEITDENLIAQLEQTLYSKNPQTNITQINDDAPFDLDISLSYTDTMNVTNIGNIYAKPILELEGSGNIEVVLNDIQILEINLGDGGKIAIDVPNLQAYNPDDDTLMNRLVTGDYMKLLIQEGDNTITFNGSVTSATLTKYTRYI